MRLKKKEKVVDYNTNLPRAKQKIFPLFTSLCLLFIFCHCYTLKQGWGQLEILYKRKPIVEILGDPKTPQAIRTKLSFVEKVRKFAEKEIGLKVNKTYTNYTQLDRSVLAWNVVASEKLALRAKHWKFPIVGKVPYLGFFSLEDAKEEAEKLRKEGWDVRISVVAAYSTLGWFDDPLLSTQLRYPNWYLASLLIHECAHATLWVKGDVSFNEAFASFVGRQGAFLFYQKTGDSKGYQKMLSDLARNKRKRQIYRHYTYYIQRLYGSKLKDEIKLQKRKVLFSRLEKELIRNGFRKPRKKGEETQAMNNVDLISFSHYHSGANYFAYEFRRCKKSWSCFLEKMDGLKKLSVKERSKVWRRIFE